MKLPKLNRIKNTIRFVQPDKEILFAYNDDYMVINDGEIWIVKKMMWGSKTTAWIAFNATDRKNRIENQTLAGLKENMAYNFDKVS